jgi:toxin ParE1/3/4
VTERVRLTSEASTELAEAVRWYEERQTGLGGELLAAVQHTLSLIADRPDIGRSVPGTQRSDVKRLLVPRFPYQLLYRAYAETIIIVAVAHLKRRPDYWKSRG